jgi:asparagine synthase (glutamine-hydrolysing)
MQGWFHPRAAGAGVAFAETAAVVGGERRFVCAAGEVSVSTDRADAAVRGGRLAVVLGRPRFADPALAARAADAGAAALLAETNADAVDRTCAQLRGSYAVALIDVETGAARLQVDRFSARPLCYAATAERLAFADRADAVPAPKTNEIDAQAIFRYLYFHCIPAPGTVYAGIERLRAGEALSFRAGRADRRFHWLPRFSEPTRFEAREAAAEFRRLLEQAVEREMAGVSAVGSFLSGGTDSSTVTGLLGKLSGRPARAYSIGFEAEGYDEMSFARTAARHFGAEHHAYYVTPDDLVRAIPQVAAWYDQPFGNSSALPAYYCARAAHDDGVQRILAGDGGDELFGGNSRYAKQKVFQAYFGLPAGLRRALIEPALLGPAVTRAVPIVKKARSYVEQARAPMPARMNTYNLLRRIGRETLLTPAFLARVNADGPQREQQETWDRFGGDVSLVNHMLAYDWQYTLADSDLPKVCGTTSMAGLQVGFPMLDDDLLDFSLRLPSEQKVKGLALRHFFKEALRGFLPDEIIRKTKHGFGLPFGIWLRRHAGLQKLVHDALGSLGARGFIRPDYIRTLEAQLGEHAGYYGELAWVLMMLEHWLASRDVDVRL